MPKDNNHKFDVTFHLFHTSKYSTFLPDKKFSSHFYTENKTIQRQIFSQWSTFSFNSMSVHFAQLRSIYLLNILN